MDIWLLVHFLIFLSLVYLALVNVTYFVAVIFILVVVFYRRWSAFKNHSKLPTKTLSEHLKIMQNGLNVNKFHQYSAFELAEFIRTQEFTSEEIVRAHIQHLQVVNPALNAMVKDRFNEAIEEAKKVDRMIKSAKNNNNGHQHNTFPPLFGVPFTVKECFALKGMPQSSGLYKRKDFIAEEDATAVKRFLEAGAIPLCVTNVSELCMWMESNNKVYGRTYNPYNPTRTVGGSSGGEGCVIGSGASPFGSSSSHLR